MKNKSLLLAIVILSYINASAQDAIVVSAGTTFSSIKGMEFKLKHQFGYYAGFGLLSAVDKRQTFITDLNYLYQRASNEIIKNESQSLNLSVLYGYRPFDFNLNILAGIQMGFVMNSKVQVQDSIIRDRDVRFSGVGGLSYDFNKFSIVARYSRKFDGSDVFDSALQVGVSRKIK